MPNQPNTVLKGHEYAVKRIKCSPHDGNVIGSTSYDMTMRIWNLAMGKQVFVHDKHTEFVQGIDFSLFVPGLVATCAWDESVDFIQL